MGDNALSPWDDDEAASLLRKQSKTVELPEVTITAEKKPWYQALADAIGVDPSRNPTDPSTWTPEERQDWSKRNESYQSAADNPGVVGAHVMAPYAGMLLTGGGSSIAGSALAAGLGAEASGTMENYARDPEEGVAQAAVRAMPGAVLGAGIGGGAAAVGKLSGAIGEGLDWLSDKARGAVFGNAGAYNRLAQKQGLGAVQNLGSLPEELGVTNRWIPQDAAKYTERLIGTGENIGGRAAEFGQGVRGAVEQADQQLAPGFVDKAAIVDQLRNQQAAAASSGAGDAAAEAGALDSVATGMGNRTLNTPSDLWRTKTFYDQRAYPDAVGGTPESFMGQAHAAAGNAARGQLRDIMQYTLPETEQAFTQNSQNYGNALTLGKLARAKAAAQDAGGFTKSNFVTRYAPDAIANLSARGAEGLGAVSGGANWIAQAAPTAASMAANMAAEASGGRPLMPDSGGDEQQQAAQGMRGHLLPQQIAKALQTAPAVLGPYAQQLSQAKDDEELSAMIERLRRTDPEFETTIVPRFQGM